MTRKVALRHCRGRHHERLARAAHSFAPPLVASLVAIVVAQYRSRLLPKEGAVKLLMPEFFTKHDFLILYSIYCNAVTYRVKGA